jgi:hypothetical protein
MKPTLAILALTTPTLADGPLQGTATWLYDVTTQDGDALVEPGETATITLSVLMELAPDDGPYLAFAASIFDVLGAAGAEQGHILGWQVLNHLADLTGDLTTTDGVSLFNINAGQLTGSYDFSDDNPIDVITFEWAPDSYTDLEVAYDTTTDYNGPYIYVWQGEDYWVADIAAYPVTEAAITFTVIPAPATAILFATAGATRRRRRT